MGSKQISILFIRIAIAQVLFLALSSTSFSSEQIDFVLDMDDTIVRWIRPNEEMGSSTVIPKEGNLLGYRYRQLNGVPEFIESLTRIPNAKIWFFSKGPRARNISILEQIKLPDGRSAKDVAAAILSEPDVDIHPHRHFSSAVAATQVTDPTQWVKDLKKGLTLTGGSLNSTIFIDDKTHYIFPGQEKNFIWAGPQPPLFQIHPGIGPLDNEAFYQYHNKLAWVRGVIDRVLELAKKENFSIAEANARFQKIMIDNGEFNFNKQLLNDVSLYQRGNALLQEVNPNFRPYGGAHFYPDVIRCVSTHLSRSNL